MKNKVVFIVGPTGVGKTNLAFEIAKKYNGELISADSVQVYKGLDIISGKDLPPNYKSNAGYYSSNSGPSIHLLDVVNTYRSFSVYHFLELATKAIASILEKNKLPIVVGGTGLYIKSLTEGLDINVKPDDALRNKLGTLSVTELQKLLSTDNLEKLNDSDRMNSRRLIRAIEKSRIVNRESRIKNKKTFENFVIGVKCDREVLNQRIDIRVEERLKNGAMIEAEKLFENYEKLSQQVKDANGYKQLFKYLRKEITLDEAIYRWKVSEYRHAKNQMTWFTKYGNVKWFEADKVNIKKDIEKSVNKFLKTN